MNQTDSDVDRPVITVVIPARDEQLYLAVAIDSVLSQDLTAIECIVVDDGSIDYTLDIAAEAAMKDPRVRILRHDVPRGLPAARNTGLAAARGTHITFLDGDDYLFPSSLSSRNRALARAAYDVLGAYCDWKTVPQFNPPMKPCRPPRARPEVSQSTSDNEPPFIATAPLLRADALRSLGGFDETFTSAEDFELWLRALRAGYRFVPVHHIGVAYRQRIDSMVLASPATHATHMAMVYDRADSASDGTVVSVAVRAKSLAGSAVLTAATGDSEQIETVLALASVLPVGSFGSDQISDALARSVARPQKAGWTGDIEQVLNETCSRLAEVAGSATPNPFGGLEPTGPLNPETADRAAVIREPNITPIHVRREAFGGIVTCPLARYHCDELVPMTDELRARGHRVSFLLAPREAEDVRKEMRKYNEQLFAWPSSLNELPVFDAVVTLNDWGPVNPLIKYAGELNVPSFSKVEGVQDFEDVETNRLRKPYRWTDHVLCQGANDVRHLLGRPCHIVGSTRLERIARGPERSFSASSRTVVINSNFTYNVLLKDRDTWIDSALEGCKLAGASALISRHHADLDPRRGLPIDTRPIRRLFHDMDVLVSRFSTVPFEAMAHGVPFVYHNPHNERVPTFNVDTAAFRVTSNAKELGDAIAEALEWRGTYREQSRTFFMQQVDIDPAQTSETRAAAVIDRIVSLRPQQAPTTGW